jgi:putative endonuclease
MPSRYNVLIKKFFGQRLGAALFGDPRPPHLLLGAAGEDLAANYLRNNGHKILYRNFRASHGGEVDIVCRDRRHDELVFVEVKTRSSEEYGRPLDSVDQKKRRLILRGAMTWLKMLDMPDIVFRFDVVEVVMPDRVVRHIPNAFGLPQDYSY